MIISAVTVYFRDLEHIISVLLLAWMYLTPIVYPTDMIPAVAIRYFRINPMLPIIEAYRDVVMFDKFPDFIALAYVMMLSIIIFVGGYYVFDRLQRRFAEEM
jgi:lipopolysaccharide transport system permease protein